MNVSIIGTGYVGLVTALGLAEHGHKVTCVDCDASKVNTIKAAKPPFFEAGVEEMLARHINRNLSVTVDARRAVEETDITMVAVGTPFDGNQVDLGQVRNAVAQVGEALTGKNDYHVVVIKSTVPPGTADEVVRPILEAASGRKVGAEVGLATNPEFLKEGEAVHDFLHPDRIVVGAVDERSLDTVAALYKSFSGVQLVRTNNRTAEMIKYTANALWATLISFSNEIGNFCGALNGVDVVEVMRGVHLDKRLTPAAGDRLPPGVVGYLSAGCGFGGSCLPKDVKSLVAEGRKLRLPMRILSAVVEVNRDQPKEIIAALDRNFDSLAGRRVAVLGLAFKAGTDDVRESAAIPVLRMLLERSAVIQVYDPVANAHALPLFDRHAVIACDSVGQCVTGADAVVILTSWDQFRALPELISDLPEPPVVIDGRRLIDRDAVPFYEGIGFGKGRPRALRPERHAVEQNANVN